MTAQWFLVGLVASVAMAYLTRQAWRTWAGGCSKSCGCSAAVKCESPALISTSDLVARMRNRQPGGQ
jgi:hypothetical protein